jgi:hypothetical protein
MMNRSQLGTALDSLEAYLPELVEDVVADSWMAAFEGLAAPLRLESGPGDRDWIEQRLDAMRSFLAAQGS